MAEQSTTQNPHVHSATTIDKSQQPCLNDQTVPINLILASRSKYRGKKCRILFDKNTPPVPHQATVPIRIHYTPPTYLTIPSLSTYCLFRELLPCIPWPDTCPFLQHFYLQTWFLTYSDFKIQALYTSLRNDLLNFTTVREDRDAILDAQDTRISSHDLLAEELLPMAHQRVEFCKAFLQDAKVYLSHSRRRTKEAAEIAIESCEMALAARAACLDNSDSTSSSRFGSTSNSTSNSNSNSKPSLASKAGTESKSTPKAISSPKTIPYSTTKETKKTISTLPNLDAQTRKINLLGQTQTRTTSSACHHITHARYFSSKHEKDTTWFDTQTSDVEQQLCFFLEEVKVLEREVVAEAAAAAAEIAEEIFGTFDLEELGAWFREACRG